MPPSGPLKGYSAPSFFPKPGTGAALPPVTNLRFFCPLFSTRGGVCNFPSTAAVAELFSFSGVSGSEAWKAEGIFYRPPSTVFRQSARNKACHGIESLLLIHRFLNMFRMRLTSFFVCFSVEEEQWSRPIVRVLIDHTMQSPSAGAVRNATPWSSAVFRNLTRLVSLTVFQATRRTYIK